MVNRIAARKPVVIEPAREPDRVFRRASSGSRVLVSIPTILQSGRVAHAVDLAAHPGRRRAGANRPLHLPLGSSRDRLDTRARESHNARGAGELEIAAAAQPIITREDRTHLVKQEFARGTPPHVVKHASKPWSSVRRSCRGAATTLGRVDVHAVAIHPSR